MPPEGFCIPKGARTSGHSSLTVFSNGEKYFQNLACEEEILNFEGDINENCNSLTVIYCSFFNLSIQSKGFGFPFMTLKSISWI